MATFIDSDELLDNIHAAINNTEQYFLHETNLAPVVHAHWIADSRYCEYTCSHCGDGWRGDFDLDPSDDHFYYCPNCGAIMDEEVE